MRTHSRADRAGRLWAWSPLVALCCLLGATPAVFGQDQGDGSKPADGDAKKDEGLTDAEKRKQEQDKWKEELKLRESQVKDLIKKCESSRPDVQWQIIGEIGKVAHPQAVAYLKMKLYFENPAASIKGQVRAAAADAMKGQRDKFNPGLAAEATKHLQAACDERWNKRETDGDAVVRNSIKAIGELRHTSSKKWLLKMITAPETYWAEESIRALEKLRDGSVIEKIIQEWLRSENEGKKTNASDKDRERRQVIGEAAGSTLAALTGQQFSKPLDWQQWWSKNKSTFVVKKIEEDAGGDQGGGEGGDNG